MEHCKSTLATTVCAVFGLVVAAHVLHPGNYEPQVRPARTTAAGQVAAAPAAPTVATTWIDPPARAVAPVGSVPVVSLASASPSVGAEAIPSETAAQIERASKSVAGPRTKSARRTARTRRAAVARTAQADRAAAPTAPAPRERGRIDPIGDIIRGLGLGGAG